MTTQETWDDVGAARLERIKSFVDAHDFGGSSRIEGGKVVITIPFTRVNGPGGVLEEAVTTFQEARDVLGY